MKSIIVFAIIGFLTLVNNAAAQQVRFDEANSLLQEGQFEEAATLYRSIADSGYTSGSLWLNLGIVYSRLDSLGMAKYYLMRAEEYEETEDRAAEALRVINERFPRQSVVLPPLPWNRLIRYLADSVGITIMAMLGLFFFYAAAALLIGSWFRLDFKKALFRSGSLAFGVSVLCFILAFVIHYRDLHYDTGVMVQNEAEVYAEPMSESTLVSTAYEGYTMRVNLEESEPMQEWSYVRLENGMYGWIKNEAIRTF